MKINATFISTISTKPVAQIYRSLGSRTCFGTNVTRIVPSERSTPVAPTPDKLFVGFT